MEIDVFKFGGASLRDARGLRNTTAILQSHQHMPLIVVVSAMGKTTNALERILELYSSGNDYKNEWDRLYQYHVSIARELMPEDHPVFNDIDALFNKLAMDLTAGGPYDMVYDQVISKGELLSSRIVHHYLVAQNVSCQWIDARQCIMTDSSFREGKIDWALTTERIQSLKPTLTSMIITQGFIGSTKDGWTTTLGREGSDFTAAIFASCLDASSVTIWKDVPGVMNADPKRLSAAIVFKELPYHEAAEMTYYGASVIHPKTIKPLANKNIPLYVKNFDNPSLKGTVIHDCKVNNLPPLIVFKDNQCLISCKVTDYTFINEQQLSVIFGALSELNIKINVMQNSAISFSFCIDFRESKLSALIKSLQEHFEVYYNKGLTLITIKNYTTEEYEMYRTIHEVLLEQSSRSTMQILVRERI